MAYSFGDAAHDAHLEELRDAALREAMATATRITAEFVAERSAEDLQPELRWELTAGGDDQPLFRFVLLVGLDDDFDAGEFPTAAIESLVDDARQRIADSLVDDWDWFISVNVKGSDSP